MNTLKIINLKCNGCANTIKRELVNIGAQNVLIDLDQSIVCFEGDIKLISDKLASLGYPVEGSEGANDLFKKAKSFISCAIGKIKK